MDVSPQTIRQVQFREKLRGYHQDDVDEFLERVAAGVEIMQERLRIATERAVKAEQQATESHEDDDSLRRMLVLAQRTSDLAVKEAKEQAARLVAEAETEAAAAVAEAAEEARRMAEAAQAQMRADVERLESDRRQLTHDVEQLVRYLDEQRARARAVLVDAARGLEDTLLPPPPPAPSGAELSPARADGIVAEGLHPDGPAGAGYVGDAEPVEGEDLEVSGKPEWQ